MSQKRARSESKKEKISWTASDGDIHYSESKILSSLPKDAVFPNATVYDLAMIVNALQTSDPLHGIWARPFTAQRICNTVRELKLEKSELFLNAVKIQDWLLKMKIVISAPTDLKKRTVHIVVDLDCPWPLFSTTEDYNAICRVMRQLPFYRTSYNQCHWEFVIPARKRTDRDEMGVTIRSWFEKMASTIGDIYIPQTLTYNDQQTSFRNLQQLLVI